jgi:hypothetical protein
MGGRGRLAGLWPSRPRTMRFPYIRSEPATKAERQRSVFASLASLIASWIYYTLLHLYTVVECIIYPSQPDLTNSCPDLVFLKTVYIVDDACLS